MKIILGLGNPGVKYARTRHNIGRLLIQYCLDKFESKTSKRNDLEVHGVSVRWKEEEIFWGYPTTYMNLSGIAVRKITTYYNINVSKDLLIVVDDIALPFGKLRFRVSGSDGGHNGLKSVTNTLQTRCFSRLRIGIGNEISRGDLNIPLEEFVLDTFTSFEKEELTEVLERGYNAVQDWLVHPPDKAMNIINTDHQRG
ncbi:MAG: aminoacyl-tRNA hydrolase [Candidatus Omnitrophica bacterium]|nr:aminoacyl-tRNA hydrolase [Candidatus Omnitrophota bacterium]